jgi:hypothetical protein
MKQNLFDRKLKHNCEVNRVVTRWLATQKTDLYQQGTANFFPRRGKCISSGKDYVEKQWYISRPTIKCELFLLGLKKNKICALSIHFLSHQKDKNVVIAHPIQKLWSLKGCFLPQTAGLNLTELYKRFVYKATIA